MSNAKKFINAIYKDYNTTPSKIKTLKTKKDFLEVFTDPDFVQLTNRKQRKYMDMLAKAAKSKGLHGDEILDAVKDKLDNYDQKLIESYTSTIPSNKEELDKKYTKESAYRNLYRELKKYNNTIVDKIELSASKINDLIDNPKKYHAPDFSDPNNLMSYKSALNHYGVDPILELSNQKNFNKSHVYKLLDKHPMYIDNLISKNNDKSKLVTEDQFVIRKFFENAKKIKNFKPSSEIVERILSQPDLPQESVKYLIYNTDTPSQKLFNNMMDKLDDNNKEEVTDAILGITGGKYREPFEPDMDRSDPHFTSDEQYNQYVERMKEMWNDEDNWDNWENGDKHNYKLVNNLIDEGNLTDAQIDHIKRHGDLDNKIRLLDSKNIDPKHKADIVEKFIADDHEHGYDYDEFKESLREEFENNYSDEIRGLADQRARDYYSENEFLNNVDRDVIYDAYPDEMQDYTDKILEEKGINEDSEDYDDEFDNAKDEAYDNIIRDLKNGNLEFTNNLLEMYDEEIDDLVYNHDYIDDAKDELFDNYINNYEYLSQEDLSHPAFKHIENRKYQKSFSKYNSKKQAEETNNAPFLEDVIPNRFDKYEYGTGQRHLEMLKDYADSNNGKIDMGRMIKMYPNLKERWKQIFNGKGILKTDEIQQKIDNLPKQQYNISFGVWNPTQIQNTNKQKQLILRLDHTPESYKPIYTDTKAHSIYQKIIESAQDSRSGHPVLNKTIGWVRVDTSNPKHWFIDEAQSDFGNHVRRFLKSHNRNDEAAGAGKILDVHKEWREPLLNAVITLAKKNNVNQISTHSPESKSAHTNSDKVHTVYKDSYSKIPRKMGFKPSLAFSLPLTEKGEKIFHNGKTRKELEQAHNEAIIHHLKRAEALKQLAQKYESEGDMPASSESIGMSDYHIDFVQKHKNALNLIKPNNTNEIPKPEIDPQDIANANKSLLNGLPEAHENDKLINLKPLSGHTLDLNPKIKKAELDLVTDLFKFEYILDQAESQEIKKRAQYNISLIKNILKIEEENTPVSGSHLKKAEILLKGSLQRKRFPVTKEDMPTEENTKNLVYWVRQSGQRFRNKIPPMSENVKGRALHSLSGKTEVRRNPETGERMFLLHRGIGPFEKFHDKEKGITYKPNSDIKTSWTPKYEVAVGAAYDSNNLNESDLDQAKKYVISAWIPESSIHSVINKVLPKKATGKYEYKKELTNPFPNENEIIVSHNKEFQHAHPNLVNKKGSVSLNEKINTRKPNSLLQIKEKKLTASEIIDNDLQKGSRQKKIPFNPRSDEFVTPKERKYSFRWENNNDKRPNPLIREAIPKAHPHALQRIFNKLHGQTEVRRHPETGERMFLLHRAVTPKELLQNHKNGVTKATHSKMSWYPQFFDAERALRGRSKKPFKYGEVISAWIPESAIHSMPKQILEPSLHNERRQENEIIVNHTQPMYHAHPSIVNKLMMPHGRGKTLNEQINTRSKNIVANANKKINFDKRVAQDNNHNNDDNTSTATINTNDNLANTATPNLVEWRQVKKSEKWRTQAEILTKGDLSNKIKTGIASLVVAGNVHAASPNKDTSSTNINSKVPVISHVDKQNTLDIDNILKTIAQVETSGGKNMRHKTVTTGLNKGTRSSSKYGLMPLTIKETIKNNKDLLKKYGNLLKLKGEQFHNAYHKNPNLDREIAARHVKRIGSHFNNDVSKIGRAWIGGITGTKKAIKNGEDINNHWYVKRFINYYNKFKNGNK